MPNPSPYFFPMNAASDFNNPGVTKREWFAGMAMLGQLSGDKCVNGPDEWKAIVRSVILADAMIAELAKGEGE